MTYLEPLEHPQMFFRNPKDSVTETIDQRLRFGKRESGTNKSVKNQLVVSRNDGMRNWERKQNITMQMPNQLLIRKSYRAYVHLRLWSQKQE